jgi:hypothetical protein
MSPSEVPENYNIHPEAVSEAVYNVGSPVKHFFLFRLEPKATERQAVSVAFVKL